MSATRKPPLPATFTAPRVKGQCRWCGQPTIGKRRLWHEGCLHDYKLLTDATVQRDSIRARDHGVCVDCGVVRVKIATACQHDFYWTRIMRRGDLVDIIVPPLDEMMERWRRRPHREPDEWGPSCPVRYAEDWEVDHEIPLWKVADLPDDQRIWYFTLANLATRCSEDHKRKSAREAAERAKFKRIERSDGMRRPKQRGREPLPF